MWTETPEGHALIRDITQTIVTQVAPEELDLFDELLQEYFTNPQPAPQTTSSDDPLGFGVGEVVAAITPAAAAMVSVVLSYLLPEVLKVSSQESAALIMARAKKLFQRMIGKTDTLPPLTHAQLTHVKNLACQQALKFGVKAKIAEQMATALAGSLALTKVD